MTNLDADHENDGEDHKHAGEDDVAGDPEQGGGDQLTLDVLNTGNLPPPHSPGGQTLPGSRVDPEDAAGAERQGGARLHVQETYNIIGTEVRTLNINNKAIN